MEDIKHQLDTDSIRKSVADGSYFNNTKKWFDDIYHRPIGERSFFILIMFLSATTIFFSTLSYVSMLPLSRTAPYTIYSEDISEELPIISRLRKERSEDINISLARFLISNYVKEREYYKYNVIKLEWQFNRIRSTSSADEFARYQKFVNPENPSSPFTKYGRKGLRDVNVYKINLDLDSSPKLATVYFTTTLLNGKHKQRNNWVSNITFRFPKLIVDQETNEVLQFNTETKQSKIAKEIDFRVNNYSAQEIIQRHN